jgi:hypothetical protein
MAALDVFQCKKCRVHLYLQLCYVAGAAAACGVWMVQHTFCLSRNYALQPDLGPMIVISSSTTHPGQVHHLVQAVLARGTIIKKNSNSFFIIVPLGVGFLTRPLASGRGLCLAQFY